jgi:hypothetical protein
MAALGLMPGPSVSTFHHKVRDGAGGKGRKAGAGGRGNGGKQEVRMSLPSEVGRGEDWGAEGGGGGCKWGTLAGRADRAVSQSTELYKEHRPHMLPLKSVSTSPHVGLHLQHQQHTGAHTERAAVPASHSPNIPPPRAPPPGTDAAGSVPLRKAPRRPLSASRGEGDGKGPAEPRHAWLPSAAPFGVDVAHAPGALLEAGAPVPSFWLPRQRRRWGWC